MRTLKIPEHDRAKILGVLMDITGTSNWVDTAIDFYKQMDFFKSGNFFKGRGNFLLPIFVDNKKNILFF
jgi:hypothetical protein